MTKMESLAVQVFFDTCRCAEESNPFNAYDKCEMLKSLIDDLKDEVQKYQDYCEKCADSVEPQCYL